MSRHPLPTPTLKNSKTDPTAFRRVQLSDIGHWILVGWDLFRRTAAISILYSGVFAVIGLCAVMLLASKGLAPLIYPVTGGFLLIGPILLPGFFQVSARVSAGQKPRFSDLLLGFRRTPGALWLLFSILALMFLVWLADAVVLYAMYFGTEPVYVSVELLNDPLFTDHLMPFLIAGSLMGLALALAIYMVSVFSVPLMLHQNQDFAPAVIASIRAVTGNFVTMMVWGVILALTLVLSILVIPLFVLVFPVLAYASDQAYRDIWGADG